MDNCAVIVLAGGNSSRMNSPKPWLVFVNNATFLENIVNSYNEVGFKKIVISLNKKFFLTAYTDRIEQLKKKATFVEIENPEKGRLFSLQLALKVVGDVDVAFIQNVDNPFIDETVINTLYKERISDGVTIPKYQEKAGHPIIISKNVIKEIVDNYMKYETLKELTNQFEKKYVKVYNSDILININTPLEYHDAINEHI